MSLEETLAQIINRKTEERFVPPSKKLSKVIKDSGIVELVEGLSSSAPLEVSKEVIENGKKMVVTLNWGQQNQRKQAIVSITEGSVSFIGNNVSNNYKRLEGQDMKNRGLMENFALKMFSDPSKL